LGGKGLLFLIDMALIVLAVIGASAVLIILSYLLPILPLQLLVIILLMMTMAVAVYMGRESHR